MGTIVELMNNKILFRENIMGAGKTRASDKSGDDKPDDGAELAKKHGYDLSHKSTSGAASYTHAAIPGYSLHINKNGSAVHHAATVTSPYSSNIKYKGVTTKLANLKEADEFLTQVHSNPAAMPQQQQQGGKKNKNVEAGGPGSGRHKEADKTVTVATKHGYVVPSYKKDQSTATHHVLVHQSGLDVVINKKDGSWKRGSTGSGTTAKSLDKHLANLHGK